LVTDGIECEEMCDSIIFERYTSTPLQFGRKVEIQELRYRESDIGTIIEISGNSNYTKTKSKIGNS
jgi:hypothetical protein